MQPLADKVVPGGQLIIVHGVGIPMLSPPDSTWEIASKASTKQTKTILIEDIFCL